MDAVVQKKKEPGKYPENFFHPKGTEEGDNNGHYVIDNLGTVWMVVRDGGMVQTCDYSGRVFSSGIAWLEKHHGPLIPLGDDLIRTLRYIERGKEKSKARAPHPATMAGGNHR